jgi:hypothetical protein
MPRIMVGLLAAVSTAVAARVGLVHGHLVTVMTVGASVTSGLAAYLAQPLTKKNLSALWKLAGTVETGRDCGNWPGLWKLAGIE